MARGDRDPAVATPGAGAGQPLAALQRAARAVPGQPWSVLALLVVAQWLAVVAFALTVRHNGWLYFQGGDQTWYYTSAWAIGNGELPVTSVGWGWSTLLAPIAAIAGPSILDGLPAILILQGLLLLPLGLLSLYSIAARLGGRGLGYAAAAGWIGVPFLLILAADPRYHERWVEQFLPQLLGLTGLADFPSMVALLAAAALVLRALATRAGADALLAGLVAGFAIGIKPANALFLFGAALAFALARQWGAGLRFAGGLVPALVVLAVWKQRGLGEMPLFALDTVQLAAGAASLPRLASSPLGSVLAVSYVDVDWGRIDQNLVTLREYFWNTRLLHVLPFIGLVALGRRSLPAAGLIGGWFAAYFVVKGASAQATVDSGSFFRLLMPALPAYFLLVAAVPLLVPGLGRRLVRAGAALRPRPAAVGRRTVLAALLGLGLIPLLLLAVLPRLSPGDAVKYFQNNTYVPQTNALDLQAQALPDGTVSLDWSSSGTGGLPVFYRVMRAPVDLVDCRPVSGGTTDCVLRVAEVTDLGHARDPAWKDRPGPGTWWYAVGLMANWLDDETKGDVLLVSRAVSVSVP